MTKQTPMILGVLLSLAAADAICASAATGPHAHHQHTHPAPAPAQTPAWTARPLLIKAKGFSRNVAMMRPQGLRPAQLTVFPATAPGAPPTVTQVPVTAGKAAVRSRGKRQGGWYRVMAEERGQDLVSRASTVIHFSNPGPAPRDMLATPYPGLEVVPAALPREHRHYRAGETWPFLVRLDGVPVADQPMLFETAAGTRQTLRTDSHGLLQLTFPDDFGEPAAAQGHGGHGGQPSNAFVLSTRLTPADAVPQQAAFNFHYRAGAYAGKNPWLGGGFALLGMLAAVPLVRQRKGKEVRS